MIILDPRMSKHIASLAEESTQLVGKRQHRTVQPSGIVTSVQDS